MEFSLHYAIRRKVVNALLKDGIHFPSGLASKAKAVFQRNGIQVALVDSRPVFTPNLKYTLAKTIVIDGNVLPFALRQYQRKAVNQAISRQRGVLRAATGAGKTNMSAAIFVEVDAKPAIFYVPSKSLLHQAKAQFQKIILDRTGKPAKIGIIGDGFCDIQDINIMTTQTASMACDVKYKSFDDEQQKEDQSKLVSRRKDILELITNAQCIIMDQVHHAASQSGFQMISDYSVNAKYRWGVSATPNRDLADDILIQACFGKQFANISASYLIRNKFLVSPKIHMIDIRQGMPKDQSNYQTVYKQGIAENTIRNSIVANLAIYCQKQDRNLLILVKNIQHGNLLQQMIPGSMFLHGSHSQQERKTRIDLMKKRDKSARITIASTIFDQGLDVPSLDALILAGGGKSASRALQRIGRVIRLYTYPDGSKKTDAIVFDFEDHAKYLLQHSKKRRKMYQSQDAFQIIDVKE